MIDRVHRHASDARTPTTPARAPCFATRHIHMINVADLANGRISVFVNTADLAGGQFHQRVTPFAVVQCRLLAGAPRNLAATSRSEFNVVDVSAERNRAKRQRVSEVGRDILSGHDCRSNTESIRCKNVTQLAIRIFNKSDSRGTVRIILNPDYFRGDAMLAPFEIDLAILLLMTAADVARCEPSKAIASAGFLFRLDETFCRSPLRDFPETRKRFEAQRRRKRAKIFQGHN